MIAIRDMDMPKNCLDCPLSGAYLTFDIPQRYFCKATQETITNTKQRLKSCPLVTVKEVKQ